MDAEVHWIRQQCSALGLAIILLMVAPAVHSASVESLLMPGPVAANHAKFESECSNCHNRTDRAQQSALCLACHKEIAADVQQRTGYHGRMPNAGTAGQCRACHSEHTGRDADIVRMNTAQFDHTLTDFALHGAHLSVTCSSCHKSGVAWAKADSGCVACHKKDDYHAGELGTKCADCHSEASWAGARFDHDQTKFALTGTHATLSCGACHLGGHYKQAPQSCVGCHATDDAHRGERGTDCGNCHSTKDWRSAKFDHFKETGFALLGRHSALACQSCHRSGKFDDKPPKDCYGCHRADDSHAARLGAKCEDCHGNDEWKPVDYDHAVKAKFALVGAHAKLSCHSCHTAEVAKQQLGTDCLACHRAANPHGASFTTGCDSCHAQNNWKSDISFDHDLTKFPLLGLHIVVSCAQCHRTQAFADAPGKCVDCHTAQDVHKGGLGKECDTCHSSNGWAIWNFDHGKQTGFALTGAHAKNKCADCHRKPASEVKLRSECISCHLQDDIHSGQFGRQCERCHTTATFMGGRAR